MVMFLKPHSMNPKRVSTQSDLPNASPFVTGSLVTYCKGIRKPQTSVLLNTAIDHSVAKPLLHGQMVYNCELNAEIQV